MSDPKQEPAGPDPYEAYIRLRAGGPVQKIPTGSGGRWSYLVTGYAEAREAFTAPHLSKSTARFFADKPSTRDLHPAVSQNMLATDPPEHTRLRRLVAKAFTTRAVERLRPYITRLVDELLDHMSRDSRSDLIADLAVPLPVTVICQMLGVPEKDRPRLRSWSNDLFAAGDPARIDATSHQVAHYISGLIDAKRAKPDESLLSDLIQVCDGEDRMSERELVSMAVLLLVAGHETTANFIGNAVLALLQHPDVLARLRNQPDLIRGALDELLRFDSPVSTATFRYGTEATSLGDSEIAAGVPVLIAIGAANRDPRQYPDPDQLDLDRDARSHLAFGHGIHHCLGTPLARAESEIALTALLARFPRVALAVPVTDLRWRDTRLMRGLESLPVTLS
ncbi:cytochrome [Streptomyces nanshensis]|nr:cytochrome [Streptomyces nanshensis]